MTGRCVKVHLPRFGLDAFRRHDGEQMADGRRDDILVVLEVIVVLLKLAERLGDVAGDGRFFRDDECFTHLMRRACTPGAANMRRKCKRHAKHLLTEQRLGS